MALRFYGGFFIFCNNVAKINLDYIVILSIFDVLNHLSMVHITPTGIKIEKNELSLIEKAVNYLKQYYTYGYKQRESSGFVFFDIQEEPVYIKWLAEDLNGKL